jgi:hypothetical protein
MWYDWKAMGGTEMIRDEPPIGIIFTVICVSLFGLGWVISSEILETGNIIQGRNEGIIFCTEKPKECKISYDYLKLQENQK